MRRRWWTRARRRSCRWGPSRRVRARRSLAGCCRECTRARAGRDRVSREGGERARPSPPSSSSGGRRRADLDSGPRSARLVPRPVLHSSLTTSTRLDPPNPHLEPLRRPADAPRPRSSVRRAKMAAQQGPHISIAAGVRLILPSQLPCAPQLAGSSPRGQAPAHDAWELGTPPGRGGAALARTPHGRLLQPGLSRTATDEPTPTAHADRHRPRRQLRPVARCVPPPLSSLARVGSLHPRAPCTDLDNPSQASRCSA